jgi:hypothetical protein
MLAQHVEPVYVEVPPCPAGVPGGVHMGTGHRRAGISRIGRKDAPVALENRDLVRMALASMHSETKSYEWDAPCFHPIPSAVCWRVPGENGILVHSLSWAPVLFDYAAVPEHDASTFDHWTLDGDYIYKNLGNIKRIHLVLDSDEMFMASWAPAAENARDLSPQKLLERPIVGELVKRHRFAEAFYKGYSDPAKPDPFLFDPLKQQIFFRPARWHSEPVTPAWDAVERRALRTLYSCVAPPGDARICAALPPHNQTAYVVRGAFVRPLVKLLCSLGLTAVRVRDVFRHFWIHREALVPRLRQVMAGDREVIRWLTWRARELAYYLTGRTAPGKPPRPNR